MRKTLCKGQVSIYLCIILMSVIGLSALLVDISRISAGDALVKKAVRSAARSSLAEYSTRLKNDYGIFSLSPGKCSEAEDTFKRYLEMNLAAPEGNNSINLYNFKIEEIEVTPLFNLSEDEVFRHQILEYMKYRAPEQLLEGFVDRLQIFRDSGKMSEAYKKKVAIDKMTGAMDKSQQKLKKNIDGAGKAGEKYINGFNKDGSWKRAYDKCIEFRSRYKSLLDEISQADSAIAALKTELAGLKADDGTKSSKVNNSTGSNVKSSNSKGKNGNRSRRKEITEKLSELLDRKDKLTEAVSDAKAGISTVLGEMQQDLIEPYISLNENAAENVKNILEKGEKVSTAIIELESFLQAHFTASNHVLSDFLKAVADDTKKIRKLILEGRKAEAMLEGFKQNTEALKELSAELQTASSLVYSGNIDYIETVSGKLDELVKKYNNKITYDYEKPVKGDSKDDPRSGKVEAVKRFLAEKLLNDKNYLNNGVNIDELPSNRKLQSPSFDIEDAPYMLSGETNKTQNNGNVGVNKGCSVENGDSGTDAGSFCSGIDLYNEEGMFQENAFGIISSMGSLLSGDIAALRDEIYIDEYVMGTFKNAVTQIKDGTEAAEDTDLGGRSKKQRDTFYDCEVEYILHGNPSENTNKALTTGQVLLVRFGLDTLHVYTDSKKKELAAATAAAVAGWWTGGAGIPVISNLIMCGWGMGEALIDLRDLLDGKKVPIFKSKGDWKLDIGIPAEGTKTDSKLAFSYHDYLSLFLLTMDSKKKLGRMEDLIQFNMQKETPGFKMTGCKTSIRVEATVSMNYLFATQPFIPGKVKTTDGRHRLKVLVYEGY